MEWEKIGDVAHYFKKVHVVAIDLVAQLDLGDWIGFVVDGDLIHEQEALSMQIERQDVDYAGDGDLVGIKVEQRIPVGAEVYRAYEP